MTSLETSIATYERWLETELGTEFVAGDLVEKHRKMAKDAFSFLRATYWRWAETILDICPELVDAPAVLAIGDTHLENFGTWRDSEGRMVWGANDFDEAAVMPYPLDLVRLAASAILAGGGASETCDAITSGYADGLTSPCPIVLERDHRWLRAAVVLAENERAKFWAKFDQPARAIPTRFAEALNAALPQPLSEMRFFPRAAGTGSLGRPRFVGVATWQGGPIVREVKAILPSAWGLAHGCSPLPIRAAEIAEGPNRAPDPHYRVSQRLVVRRLSPNSRKIEVKDAAAELLAPDMLAAMGREIANCHAVDDATIAVVSADLRQRRTGWLKPAAKQAAQAVRAEQSAYRSPEA